jgi:tRNA G18 (ribose-2'-O)-methylase SpoU
MKDEYRNSVDFFREKDLNLSEETPPLILAAWELKTPDNAGSIIRLAGNLGVERVYFIHESFEMRDRKMKRVAHSSLGHVDFQIVTEEEFWAKLPDDYNTIALETTKNSTNLFTTKFPEKTVLIAGNERFGLPNSFINKCHSSVFIPIPGKTSSMNVSHAVTIGAFEWARQHMGSQMRIK